MMKPTLLVLAAGMGSRYGGLKQIDPVGPNGEILLEYSVFDAVRAGFGKVVFVIRRDIEEAFRQQIVSRIEGKLPYDFAFQQLDSLPSGFSIPEGRVKPWGTGHAILCAKEAVGEPFVAINADDYYGPEAFHVVSQFLTSGQCASTAEHGSDPCSEHCMVGFRLKNTLSEHGSVSRGVCQVDAAGQLKSVVEHTKIEAQSTGALSHHEDGSKTTLSGDEFVSMNFWGLFPTIFSELDQQFRDFLQRRGNEQKSEFYIPSVLDTLISSGRGAVKVLPCDGSWFGVTYPEDKPRVVEQISQKVQSGVYGANLWGAN